MLKLPLIKNAIARQLQLHCNIIILLASLLVQIVVQNTKLKEYRHACTSQNYKSVASVCIGTELVGSYNGVHSIHTCMHDLTLQLYIQIHIDILQLCSNFSSDKEERSWMTAVAITGSHGSKPVHSVSTLTAYWCFFVHFGLKLVKIYFFPF